MKTVDGMRSSALVILGWIALGMPAQAASFDCGKAASKNGHVPCPADNVRRICRTPKPLIILLIGLIMNSLIPVTAEASEHIKVTKEVHLENGVGIFPSTIIQTKEGGYVVTGAIGTTFAWATRVDAKGQLQWRYQIAPESFEGSNFEGAVTLNDDSTLLCGWKTVPVPGGINVVGVLTHIDKEGKVLSDRAIRPHEPGVFGNSYLKGCLPWGDGFAVIGDTDRVSGPPQPPRKTERFYWLFALDAAGNVKWEKLIPTSYGLGPRSAYVDTDRNLVVGGIRVKVSQSGEIAVLDQKKPLPFVPQIIAEADGHWKIDKRNVLPPALFKTELQPKVAYILPNQTVAQFGSIVRSNVYYAAIEWESPDRKQSEIFEFADFGWVNDAIPTGAPGEFVTIRSRQRSDLKQWGMFLSFIQIK